VVGTKFVAVTNGVVNFVSYKDTWDPAHDDPAVRGGLSVAIIGDDGLRYYGSHLSAIAAGIAPGVRVKAGQLLGLVGNSGDARTTLSHLHFGISRPHHSRRLESPPRPGGSFPVPAGLAGWAQRHSALARLLIQSVDSENVVTSLVVRFKIHPVMKRSLLLVLPLLLLACDIGSAAAPALALSSPTPPPTLTASPIPPSLTLTPPPRIPSPLLLR